MAPEAAPPVEFFFFFFFFFLAAAVEPPGVVAGDSDVGVAGVVVVFVGVVVGLEGLGSGKGVVLVIPKLLASRKK